MLGLDPEKARAAEPGPASDAATDEDEQDLSADVDLEPELWDAWLCFLGTWRNWRVIATWAGTVYDGIDNAALESTMRMLGIKKKRHAQVFWQIRILEDEARKLRNKTST